MSGRHPRRPHRHCLRMHTRFHTEVLCRRHLGTCLAAAADRCRQNSPRLACCNRGHLPHTPRSPRRNPRRHHRHRRSLAHRTRACKLPLGTCSAAAAAVDRCPQSTLIRFGSTGRLPHTPRFLPRRRHRRHRCRRIRPHRTRACRSLLGKCSEEALASHTSPDCLEVRRYCRHSWSRVRRTGFPHRRYNAARCRYPHWWYRCRHCPG